MKIRDDRGVKRVMRLRAAHVPSAVSAVGRTIFHLVAAAVIGLLVFGAVLGGSWLVLQLVWSEVVGMIAFAAAMLSCVLCASAYFRHAEVTERLAFRMTDGGGCKACGYKLDGLTIEPDGCRVCPECGGAWRVASGGGGS